MKLSNDLFSGLLYLRGRTIQEVGGEMMMGFSIYGVAVIDGSLYSRFYGIYTTAPVQRGPLLLQGRW